MLTHEELQKVLRGEDLARPKYMADFESTTDPEDCRLWAWGALEIFKQKKYVQAHTIDEFMEWLLKQNCDIYFHNLKFDGSFIINWLLHHGWEYSDSGLYGTYNVIISGMGQWYTLDICLGYKGKTKKHVVIYDSLKKIPLPVKAIAKAFDLEQTKGEIDYNKPRPIGYELDENEKEYLYKDIKIVADALKIQFKQGLTAITSGSDSLKGYKDVITKKEFDRHFPIIDLNTNEQIRQAYKGGFTWLNDKWKEKEIGEGLVFDVNSLYPSVMYDSLLPYGNPIHFKGDYKHDKKYPLYILEIETEFYLNDDMIPIIQLKNNPSFVGNEYLKNSGGERPKFWITNIDYEMIKEHYHLEGLRVIQGYKFKAKTGLFKDFIDKWNYVKTHSTGGKKQLAKLMLNSLYGKFATNPDVTGKVPVLNEDGSTRFVVGDEKFRDPIYTAMGAFITAYARKKTISTAQKCYDRIIYCDTDSIHITGTDIPESIKDVIDDNRLGYWAWESTFSKAFYLRQKRYMYVVDGELTVKCAGMPDNIKKEITWENFRNGNQFHGKLQPKQVKGGVVLVPRIFTLKG